jgi:GT2 family glycosyltransferase
MKDNFSEPKFNLNFELNQPQDKEPELENTFVIPFIRNDMIKPMLDSLYQFTDPKTFRVIVIDQSPQGVYEQIKDQVHMYIRPYRNLGFAKAMNTGIRLADTKYVSCYNDDVEFFNTDWWSGIKATFQKLEGTCFGVNPMSPKEAAWGYGHKAPEGRTLTEDKRGVVWLHQGEPLNLEKCKTEEGYKALRGKVHGFIDGIAMWGVTFERELFYDIGLFDEKFYPGGGEDYDLNARAYDPDFGGGKYRIVATSDSWVYHKWGSSGSPDTSNKSKEEIEKQGIKFDDSYRWNNWTSLWKEPGHHPTVSRGRILPVHEIDL